MIESTGSMGRSATYAEELLVAEVTRLRQELSLAEEGLANYAQELEGAKHDIERLVQSVSGEANEVERLKAVAAEFHNIDDVAEIRRLRLRVEAMALLLYGPGEPQSCEQTPAGAKQQK